MKVKSFFQKIPLIQQIFKFVEFPLDDSRDTRDNSSRHLSSVLQSNFPRDFPRQKVVFQTVSDLYFSHPASVFDRWLLGRASQSLNSIHTNS